MSESSFLQFSLNLHTSNDMLYHCKCFLFSNQVLHKVVKLLDFALLFYCRSSSSLSIFLKKYLYGKWPQFSFLLTLKTSDKSYKSRKINSETLTFWTYDLCSDHCELQWPKNIFPEYCWYCLLSTQSKCWNYEDASRSQSYFHP